MKLKDRFKIVEDLAEAAINFIDKSPCDPDIYPEQYSAYEEYEKCKKIYNHSKDKRK